MKFVGAVAAISVILGSHSLAADMEQPFSPATPPVEIAGWSVSIAPYMWLAGISGDIAQFGSPTVHIERSFSDIFDDLKFGGMVMGEARYGEISIVGDIVYTKISSSRGTPHGIAARSVEVTSDTFTGFLGMGYSVLKNEQLTLDIVGGARLWYVDTDINVQGGILNGFSAHDSATWVDAMAGVRLNYKITPEVYLTGWSFVGAGGSDLDWDIAGAVGYRFSENFSVLAGYRALGVDYSKNGYVFDIVQSGPILGVSLRF